MFDRPQCHKLAEVIIHLPSLASIVLNLIFISYMLRWTKMAIGPCVWTKDWQNSFFCQMYYIIWKVPKDFLTKAYIFLGDWWTNVQPHWVVYLRSLNDLESVAGPNFVTLIVELHYKYNSIHFIVPARWENHFGR